MRQDLVDLTGDEELLFADGFDDAIIGVDVVNNRVVYSYGKMFDILKDMTEEEAIEHLEFNVLYAYVGERTPIYIYEVESVAGRII
jgi:hypothetical protein